MFLQQGWEQPRAEFGLRSGLCDALAVVPAQPHLWASVPGAPWAGGGTKNIQGITALAGAGSEVSHHLLGLLRQDRQQRQEALRREEVDALCFPSSVPPPSFTSHCHRFGFFTKREVGGEEIQQVLMTKLSMCC